MAFDILLGHKDEIESQLGISLVWERADQYKASWICLSLKDVSVTNEEDWPRMAKFHAEWSDRLCHVVLPYLQDFYKTYAYPTGQDKFTKEEGTNVWKHPEGKLPASELEENRAVFIEMRTFINGTGGTVHTGSKPLSTGGKRFKLTSTYPNNWIGLDIRRRTESTDKITYNISNEYRGRYAYYLLKEEDKYYLVDFADWSKRMPLPIKDCPVDWMN